LSEVLRLGTDRLPPALVRFSLINEAQLEHEFNVLGKMDLDPARDKADHTRAVPAVVIDPFYLLSSEFDSEDNREVYMVGQGDQLP
jgi:hypothetical protein